MAATAPRLDRRVRAFSLRVTVRIVVVEAGIVDVGAIVMPVQDSFLFRRQGDGLILVGLGVARLVGKAATQAIVSGVVVPRIVEQGLPPRENLV
jgi:hypothetical protein